MAIEFPQLPFSVDALEPHMSRTTLGYHYGKHHKKYIETLNSLIEGTLLNKKSLEEIMKMTFQKRQKIYNNAAQAWNHQFFWNGLDNSNQHPSAELKKNFEQSFKSIEDFKKEFEEKATGLFGSGWTWLVKVESGAMRIRNLSNAGNPLIENNEIPLLVCDVWEHAYYIDYQNERPPYLNNFWSLVNWNFVEQNLKLEHSSWNRHNGASPFVESHPPH